ncbi:MAG: prephenate dehydrogenase/arogenate dehydrogenase family protein, partial [Pseudomonadota bacterium]
MAQAIREAGLAGEIVGTARSLETRRIAAEMGLCDKITETATEAVQDADLVVLATPVGVMGELAREIGPQLKPGATVTDVGS